MKTFSRAGIEAIVVFFIFAGVVRAQTGSFAPNPFFRTLTVGASGEDVRQLQRILNQDASTRIQSSGPGSPGQETAYFGQFTRDAVVRFQEKHAQEVLIPNGLSSGTGIVGPSTRIALGQMHADSGQAIAPAALVSSTATPLPVSIPGASVQPAVNPNLKNIDKFLSGIDTAAAKQGMSSAALATIKTQILKDISTTTDLRKTFVDQVTKRAIHASTPKSFLGNVVATLGSAFERVFMPNKARAAASTPFGGALEYAYFCTCSATWLITLSPLPPTYATLLSYVPFSQIYLSYNIPETLNLLGSYTPGAGSCYVYYGTGCAPIPSEGMITPIVGSSTI